MGNLVFQATLGGQVNLVGPNTASTYNLNVPTVNSTLATLAAQTFAGTQTISSGNLVFSGTSQVVSGDFSNATVASRTAFQTSTSNSSTGIYALPNGTSTAASWQATNAADPTNASKILIATNGSTDVQLVSGINGTGTYLPLTFYTNGAEKMRLDTAGNLGIGTTSPATTLHLNGATSGAAKLRVGRSTSDTNFIQLQMSGGDSVIQANGVTGTAGALAFWRDSNTGSPVESARIDSSGNLLVGTTTSSARITGTSTGLVGYFKMTNVTGDGFQVVQFAGDAGSDNHQFFAANTGGSGNAAATMYKLGKASTGRSINAAGTINASGADYAEYMTKAGDFTVSKGDVVGINADGKLTNVFADSVSFAVKSTDPSYVGGDVWGTPEALGLSKLEDDATDEEKATFNTALEAARQAVDRVAFAGQVPVNVTGATAGQFIVPTNNNGAIIGVAVNEADMTLSQYMKAVGKVIAIEQDGRAKIIVKVA